MLDRSDVIPLIWSVIALAGMLYSRRLLREYYGARDAVPALEYGGTRKRLAVMWTGANVVEERMALAKHWFCFVAGIISITLPPPPSSKDALVARILVSLLLAGVNVTGVARSVYRFRKWKEWEEVVLDGEKETA